MPHGATRRRPGDLSTERWAKQSQKVASQKSGAEHSIQRHSSSPTRLSGGCAKPIFDHAHERSAKRQGKRGLILCPLSSNLPCRARRVELRLQQRRKTEEAGFELSVPLIRATTELSVPPAGTPGAEAPMRIRCRVGVAFFDHVALTSRLARRGAVRPQR